MTMRQIPPSLLRQFLTNNPDAVLVDVRQPWEHEMAAIPGSTLIPLPILAEQAGNMLPERNAPLVLYCHHGIRSLQACSILSSLGFTDLVNLAGGIDRYTTEVDPSIPRY